MDAPRGWHSRGYLPHFDAGEQPQMLTFRLADSLPRELLDALAEELARWPAERRNAEERRRLERSLDRSHGACWLSDPRVAALMEGALLCFDGDRYTLHAWVVMPNHVHALITPRAVASLSRIVHSWKSYVANRANRLLDRTGAFWFPDYYDRWIRDQHHFETALAYIEQNPVKAGLCAAPDLWPWGSARHRSGGDP